MASTPFFGKRESPVLPTRPSPHASLTGDAPAAATASDSPPVAPPVEGAPLSPVAEASVAVPGGSKLIVSPNIKLKGVEITDCDTLVVEGLVEATMDSRLMQIAEIGAFKGSAQIDIAEIRGSFDGDLTVRDRLVIFGTGKVCRRTNQVVKRAQRCLGPVARRNHDLFVRHGGAVSRCKHTGHAGVALGVDHDFAEFLSSTVPLSHSVLGTRPICTNTPSSSTGVLHAVARSLYRKPLTLPARRR
jgi:hypothetical protein